jgi:uncharacterized membrane protein YdjX (TVP38/TMEM64 family)
MIDQKPTSPDKRHAVIGLLLGAGVLALFFLTDLKQGLQEALRYVDSLGVWGPVVFVLVYVVACVFLLPGSVLTLGAGALFGLWKGTLLVSVASVSGATVAFLIGRYFARDWAEERLQAFPKFDLINRAVAKDGWKVVLLTRLSPAFPFVIMNYAYGLTRVSFKDYVLASWIGMLPGTVLFVYLGSLASAGAQAEGKSMAQWLLLGVGLVATIVVTVMITQRARQALNERLTASDRPTGGKKPQAK